jgi:RNA polymerase sigma-70 factor, ECF subfamily
LDLQKTGAEEPQTERTEAVSAAAATPSPASGLLLEQAYRHHKRSIVRLLRRHVESDEVAENLFHEACRVALERLLAKGIADADRLAGFLYGTARRLAYADRRRSLSRRTEADPEAVESFPDPAADPDSVREDDELAAIVRRLLAELPVERDRQLLMRLYLDERDKDEICAELGLTDEHFSRVLFRAKMRFRAVLERHGMPGLTSLLGMLMLACAVLIASTQ